MHSIHALGSYVGAGRNLQGDITVTLALDDIDQRELEQLKDNELVIEIKKYSPKRSINANAYLWKLCDEIAKKLGSDKDTIYLLQLSKYGVFVDIEIHRDAIASLKEKFRYITEFDDGYVDSEMITARCYFGSSQYSVTEMHSLLDGTIEDAHDLGISTWTDEEVNHLINNWKGVAQ